MKLSPNLRRSPETDVSCHDLHARCRNLGWARLPVLHRLGKQFVVSYDDASIVISVITWKHDPRNTGALFCHLLGFCQRV